jgi:hypothetical protein
MKLAALSAAALLALAATSANAAVNLVSNGGFETGDLTGWSNLTPGDPVFVAPGFPHSGTYSAFFEQEVFSTIEQQIATIAGHTYRIEYYLASPEAEGDFESLWDGITLSEIHSEDFPYTLYTFDVLADDTNGTLTFKGRNLDSFFLDDISVIDLDAVPEPASLSILAVGALSLLKRRKGS